MNAFLPILTNARSNLRLQAPLPPTFAAMALPPAERKRRKLWEFSTNLHCSIVGTCLTASELRKIIRKCFDDAAGSLTDHEVHQRGVSLAAIHAGPAKLLQKALDDRHAASIRKMEKAQSPEDILQKWAEAQKAGDIAGGYWAALTHPHSTADVVRSIFGDVHMLSHLVGAANRADIRQLTILEAENARLQEKVERQQLRLRDQQVEHAERGRHLDALIAAQAAQATVDGPQAMRATDETRQCTITKLEHKLAREDAHRQALEKRLQDLMKDSAEKGAVIASMMAQIRELTGERDALENFASADDAQPQSSPLDLNILYAGGPAAAAASIRAAASNRGVRLSRHDGGHSEAMSLLQGMIGKSDVVMFPVNCISHAAVSVIKRTCQQLGRRYVPLSSSGVGCFLRALEISLEPDARSSGASTNLQTSVQQIDV